MLTATYSPEDNKIRVYPEERLDESTYSRLKAVGFKWAPQQKIFVAPMWTPNRADLALELCGEIDDDDTSLVERQKERAERFSQHSEKRAAEAEAQAERMKSAAELPTGQVIVAHHKWDKAEKEARKIEAGLKKAVDLWETSQYWLDRAAGALRHAKYKELPQVRARRIKGIQADKRKSEKIIKQSKEIVRLFEGLHDDNVLRKKSGEPATPMEKALFITNYLCRLSFKFPLDKYPREKPASQYEGEMSLWSALSDGIITPDQAAELALPSYGEMIRYHERWLSHYENRIAYETAMLNEQGAASLLEKKPRPKQLPLLNYRAPEGIIVNSMYDRDKVEALSQIEMTKAEYSAVYEGQRFTMYVNKNHRVRVMTKSDGVYNYKRFCVFLTDSKVHEIPKQEEVPVTPTRPKVMEVPATTYVPRERNKFDDLKDKLKKGVEVVTVNQLFPTAPEICKDMVELADIEPGMDVMEPSAGTGNIIAALGGKMFGYDAAMNLTGSITAVEINHKLVNILRQEFPLTKVLEMDFLDLKPTKEYMVDRIVMNPPFEHADDIKHIQHAVDFLRSGGVLVALCAGGPRQYKELKPLAETWEELPPGSFKRQTNVNVVKLSIRKL